MFFADAAKEVHPEPAEFAWFALVVLAFPPAVATVFALLRPLVPADGERARAATMLRRLGPWLQAPVLLAVLIHSEDQRYFHLPAFLAASAACIALVVVHRPVLLWWKTGGVGGWSGRLIDMAVALLIAWRLLPALETDASLKTAQEVVRFHFPFQAGELAAPLAGAYPLAGFAPQYVNVLPILTIPWFRLLGFGVLPFTGLMAILSAVGLAAVYATLKRVFPANGRALALFVPYLGLACYVESRVGPRDTWAYLYNYWAVGPMRIVGPQVLLVLVAALGSGAPRRAPWGVALFGALVAANNLDFGAPALIAALAGSGIAEIHGRPPRSWPRALVRSLGIFGLSMGVVVAGYAGSVRLLAGRWPDPGAAMVFQKMFAGYGYFLYPLPEQGLYLVVLGTHLLAFSLVVVDTLFCGGRLFPRQLAVVLAYVTVFACGTFAYFVGRSHSEVLVSQFGPWALTLLLVAGGLARAVPGRELGPGALVRRPAAMALLFLLTCVASRATEMPSLAAEFTRLAHPENRRPPYSTLVSERAAFVRAHLPRGQATSIAAPDTHWIAALAGARDVFPFNHGGSIVTFAQLDLVRDEIERADVHHVFGVIRPEMAAMLRTAGFTPADTLGEFAEWVR